MNIAIKQLNEDLAKAFEESPVTDEDLKRAKDRLIQIINPKN